MIIDSDLTEHINKFRATIKEDVALRENRVMYNELNTLADMASGHMPLPIDNERLMSTILGYAHIAAVDLLNEISAENPEPKTT